MAEVRIPVELAAYSVGPLAYFRKHDPSDKGIAAHKRRNKRRSNARFRARELRRQSRASAPAPADVPALAAGLAPVSPGQDAEAWEVAARAAYARGMADLDEVILEEAKKIGERRREINEVRTDKILAAIRESARNR